MFEAPRLRGSIVRTELTRELIDRIKLRRELIVRIELEPPKCVVSG